MKNSGRKMGLGEIFNSIILPIIASASSLILFLIFFGKKIINHFFLKDIERYKTQLADKTEVLKSQLFIYANEHNIMFSRIDNQKAKAISKTFTAIREWAEPITKIIHVPLRNATEEEIFEYYYRYAEDAHNCARELSKVLGDHSIYFDESIYKSLVELTTTCLKMSADFLYPLRKSFSENSFEPGLLNEIEVQRKKLETRFNSNYSPITQEITNKFRILLGTIRSTS